MPVIETFDFLREEDELVLIAFWQTFFKLPFKYLQNIIILCFEFVKFPWEKYNILRAEEVGQMLFLHNEFLLYICINEMEKLDICCQKFLTLFNSITKSTCYNLSIMIKR